MSLIGNVYRTAHRYNRDYARAISQANKTLGKHVFKKVANTIAKRSADALGNVVDHAGSSRPKKRVRSGAKPGYMTRRYSRVRHRKVYARRRGRLPGKVKARVKKQLVGFVKDVVKCEENIGIYKKIVTGDCSANLGPDSNQYKCIWTGHNSRQGNSGAYTQEATRFTPLSAKRILDAASVLYNGKTAAVNYESATNNFSTSSTKVEVMYASYKLELTNQTYVPYWVTCFEITNRMNSQISFLDSIQDMVSSSTFQYTCNPATFGFQSTFDGFVNKYRMPINMAFTDVKGIEKLYGIKRLSKQLVKPGTSFQYQTSEKDMCVEFSKLTYTSTDVQSGSSGAVSALATYPKGEKQLIFLVEPVTHVNYATGNSTATASTSTHQAVYSVTWVVKIEEYFKIMQPRNTPVANQANKIELFQGVPSATSEDGTRLVESYGFFANQAPAYG